MNKEQQIEELYGVIDLWATNAVKINKYDGASVYNPYNAKSLAEAIYNAGYRKFNGSNFDYCIYSSDKETVEACVQAPCPVEKRISELRKETAKEILRRMAKFMNEEFCGNDAPCNFNDYDEFMYDNCKDYCEMNCENSDCRECWYQFLKARLKIR